ncbi:hypothetical protein P154DRAFT_577068 [Amniculicola lignicola CBS 123094]|uniref:Uncharacterized protein n=1 Tax=Amniculicola lignicola CBS 123094 TaxID=1392246 RepID=A0A6A5WD29_9PLEO|nr:hypothetical protein P154DRAFT_577068 [Amniculicola lignicola CBS 123094]
MSMFPLYAVQITLFCIIVRSRLFLNDDHTAGYLFNRDLASGKYDIVAMSWMILSYNIYSRAFIIHFLGLGLALDIGMGIEKIYSPERNLSPNDRRTILLYSIMANIVFEISLVVAFRMEGLPL